MPAGEAHPSPEPGTLAVQVQGAADAGGALRGLQAARRDLLTLLAGDAGDEPGAGRPRVSPATGAPGGPMLVIHDLADARPEALPGIFDLITRRLQQAGLRDAALAAVPVGGALDAFSELPNAVVLRLFPPPAGPSGTLASAWLDVAADWLTEGLGELDEVALRLLGIEFAVPAPAVLTTLEQADAARAWCDVVRGDLGDRVQAVSLTFGTLPHLALAAGGPKVGAAGLVERYGVLCDVARELAAALAYACVSFEPTFAGMAAGLAASSPPGQGWHDSGGAPPNGVAAWLLDDRVPDAFPFQLLGPAHHAGFRADSRAAVTPLSDGRSELTIREPADWLPGDPERQAAHAQGLALLEPLLVADEDFDDLVARRFGDGPIGQGGGPPASWQPATEETLEPPDLTDVVIVGRPQPHRGNRVTLMELVSWLAGEPHGEEPRSTSRPLGTFARWWARGLDDVSRQALITRAPSLAASGTAELAEAERRWAIAEWLVRTEAGTWLRAAGLVESAERLNELGPLDAEATLIDAVDLLTRAATVASVRLQLTLDVAVAGAPADEARALRRHLEAVAWDAWEQVQEHVAWVAAAEAAIHDDPGELGTTASQRVIEHCRTATTLESTMSMASVTEELWALVTSALVSTAWEDAWLAADEVAGSAANTDLRGAALTGDVPAWEQLVAADREAATLRAEEAAHAVLLQLARAYTDGNEPAEPAWDLALRGAREAPGTESWRDAIDDVRARAGEAAWERAMAAARIRVTQNLLRSSDLLGRVALVATAREAAGASARVVAAKGAAVAAAEGGDDDAVHDAAVDALRPLAGELARSALALFDRLLGYTDPDFEITYSSFGGRPAERAQGDPPVAAPRAAGAAASSGDLPEALPPDAAVPPDG